jgi:hypothetical protein
LFRGGSRRENKDMNSQELAKLRATIDSLIERSKVLRLELEDRLQRMSRLRRQWIVTRRLQRSLRSARTN